MLPTYQSSPNGAPFKPFHLNKNYPTVCGVLNIFGWFVIVMRILCQRCYYSILTVQLVERKHICLWGGSHLSRAGQIGPRVANGWPPLHISSKSRSCVAGRNNAELGSANSLHASTYYSECNKRKKSTLYVFILAYLVQICWVEEILQENNISIYVQNRKSDKKSDSDYQQVAQLGQANGLQPPLVKSLKKN